MKTTGKLGAELEGLLESSPAALDDVRTTMPRAVNAAVLLLSLAGRAEEFPGAAVHRLYAARMLEEPSCAEFVRAPKWDYPFAANVSDERAALALVPVSYTHLTLPTTPYV